MKISLILPSVLITLLLFMPNLIRAQNNSALSSDQWLEDIEYLNGEIDKTVPGFKDAETHQLYEARLTELKHNISSFTENQIILGLQNVLNTLQDEGCRVYPFQERLNYKVLPVRLYWFNDGVFVVDAITEYNHLIGKMIIAINGTSIDSLFAKLQNTLNADNVYYQKLLFPTYSMTPDWLNGIGLGNDNDEMLLTFEDGNTEKIKARDVAEYSKLTRVRARQNISSSDNFWMEYLPDQKILVVQLLRIDKDKNGKTFKKFVSDVEKALLKNEVDKLVIDNRYGGGGNGFKLNPLIDLISENDEINKKGKLFVLTARSTRGTIMELTSMLELNTKMITVGEPTGEGPNTVGDGTTIELPNLKLTVSLTKKYWPTSWEEDRRTFISPQLLVKFSHQDYMNKADPWIDKVFQYNHLVNHELIIAKSIAEALSGNYLISDRQVKISLIDSKLYMSSERKMASFFGFNTQLYSDKPGRLSSDIDGVYLYYSESSDSGVIPTHISWKGIELKIL